MKNVITSAIGIIGAIVRILITSLKTIQLKKKLSFTGFGIYAIVVIAVGAFSGIILSYGKILSFLGGYAGLDLIDGYYKAFKKKQIKFK